MKKTPLMSPRATHPRSHTQPDASAALHQASATELDVTSRLPVQEQTIGDDEDTGINEILTENMSIEDHGRDAG